MPRIFRNGCGLKLGTPVGKDERYSEQTSDQAMTCTRFSKYLKKIETDSIMFLQLNKGKSKETAEVNLRS